MDEAGLAQGLAQQPQGQGQGQMPSVGQIVKMLMQGMEPEELLEQGIPEELIMAAMEQISKEMAQVPPEQAGLAAQMVRPDSGMM